MPEANLQDNKPIAGSQGVVSKFCKTITFILVFLFALGKSEPPCSEDLVPTSVNWSKSMKPKIDEYFRKNKIGKLILNTRQMI